MIVRRYDTALAFLDAVGPTLRHRPVIHQVLLGIAHNAVREPDRYGPGALFYGVDHAGVPCGAALQTPPWAVQLSDAPTDAVRALAHAFAAEHAIDAVSGPDDAPAEFASVYARERGTSFALAKTLGTFELRTVAPVPAAPGRRSLARDEHAAVLQSWLEAFHAEAMPQDPAMRPDAGMRAAAGGRAHLWLDAGDRPVAFAVNNRDVEGWASIGPVYTPPAERGRGYATSLVAAVSRYLLAQGRPGCTLFTDLANPTSNAIYERIGYRRIGSAHQYAFRVK
jgi:RimJ/RimL family protein N-acetyltransferase